MGKWAGLALLAPGVPRAALLVAALRASLLDLPVGPLQAASELFGDRGEEEPCPQEELVMASMGWEQIRTP